VTDLDFVAPPGSEGSALPVSQVRPRLMPVTLCKLAKGQQIHMECDVRKGTGKLHAKWSPAAQAVFHATPEVRLLASELAADAETATDL
jgi:DNA-directed RNA polymerase alpha subunit